MLHVGRYWALLIEPTKRLEIELCTYHTGGANLGQGGGNTRQELCATPLRR
jgi:phosphoenolpyruvate carboxylase